MKIKIFLVSILFSTYSFGQIGINIVNPKATLDINGNSQTNPDYLTTVDGLLIPRISRLRAQNMPDDIEESTVIYVNNISDGTLTGKAEFIDAKGFYFFRDGKWRKWEDSVNNQENILANNGLSLTPNDEVIQLGGRLTKKTTIITRDEGNSYDLAISGLQEGDISTAKKIVVVDNNNVLKQASPNFQNDWSIPTPTILALDTDIQNFMNGVSAGLYASMPNLKPIVNPLNLEVKQSTIPNKLYGYVSAGGNISTTIKFPPGVYQIILDLEEVFQQSANNCRVTSYFVDFPFDNYIHDYILGEDKDRRRIHSTVPHLVTNQGMSKSSVKIMITTVITKDIPDWFVLVGRGQSTDCNGSPNGITIVSNLTQLTIYRMGDAD